MPENTNIIFFDEYKKLDKLCSEMYGKNSGGVTCYLNDMMAVPVMQRNRIPEWDQTYDRLRELRYIRNQMAHGEGSFEDYPCSEEDVLWLFEFRSKIMHISDPLAVDQSQTERNVIDHQRMKMDNVEVIDEEEDDSFEKKHSMLKEIAVFGLIVLLIVVAVLLFGKVYVEYFLLS